MQKCLAKVQEAKPLTFKAAIGAGEPVINVANRTIVGQDEADTKARHARRRASPGDGTGDGEGKGEGGEKLHR